MNRSVHALAAVALVVTGLASSATGQKNVNSAPSSSTATATPRIEQFMKIRAPNSPRLAQDGTLYVRDWPDGVNQIYKRDAGKPLNAPMKQLTNLPDGVNSYSLSPDGSKIVFAAAIGGSEQDDLYLLDPASGEIKPLLVNPKVVYGFKLWLHDNSGFVFSANDTSPADFHLYRYDLAKAEATKLLAKSGSWTAVDITNDGARLMVQEYISESQANAYELDAATGTLTSLNVGGEQSFNEPVAYMPGEKSAIVVSDVEQGINRMFVRDLATGKVDKPMPALDPFPFEGGGLNEDRSLGVVLVNEGGYGAMHVVELPSFKLIQLPDMEKGVVGGVDIRGRTVTFTQSNARTPGISYAFEAGSSSDLKQLTTADTQGVDLSKFTLPELITYKSFDGLEIPAFIFTPANFKKGQQGGIPFVVNFHGGPEGQSRPGFSALTQFLLASGYGVMQPNVRGSVGYGREFHMLDNYKKRWDSVKDGAEAARWLVKNGYSENGRIAAYGGSYGGFMAVATVIEGADVFGASINVVGIVNMKTFLEQTKDYRRKLREAEYGPLSDPEFLATISSINRIEEIKVPMFIAHGLNDPRVPVGEAMQLAVGLQKRGYDPELLFFPDEGHGFAKLENRLLFAKRMVKFLQGTIAE
jgi:dipeptidyl aminopeptidase/acylaminoacyl peptidase